MQVFVVGGTDLAIVDASDPSAPRKVSEVPAGVQPRNGDVAVLGRYAYVVGNHYLATFDVSNKAAPKRLYPAEDQKQSMGSALYSAWAGKSTDKWEACAKRLVVRRSASGVHVFMSTPLIWLIYDVTSPRPRTHSVPTHSHHCISWALALSSHSSRSCVVFGSRGGMLQVTDPAEPRMVFKKANQCGDKNRDDFIGCGLAFAGVHHLLISGLRGLAVWDVRSPETPKLVGFNKVPKRNGGDGKSFFTTLSQAGSEVVVRGGFAFVMSP